MSKRAAMLIAGMSAATITCAPIFADDTTEILNGQVNLDAAITVVTEGETDQANSVSQSAIGAANALTVDVVERHDIQSDQTFSGSVDARAETRATIIDGAAITTASAMGNSASVINDNGMDAQINQTALDGSTVSATARLEVGSYAISSITSATASANAFQGTSYGSDTNLALRQDSGADVSADGYVLAPDGGLGYAATVLGAANGNSAQLEGYYNSPSQVVDVDQDNRGAVTARARTDAGGTARTQTVVSSANGNSVWMQNENGYAHIQGEQDNEGAVTAESEILVGNFDADVLSVSAEGVGNSAIISNIGADAFMGLDQTNNGAVIARANLGGDAGGSALVSATAFGNAATTYVCSECPVTAWGNTNQTNNAAVSSFVTGSMNTGGVLSGAATAIGNSATYQTVNPHAGN
ncbi:holdfast anchor protein HfaD [Maricaulis maris]|uniref:holdfast anchor protein HfaD n=1 Tax=Maricaulis maris TaxID=74318 RepID=UPI003A8DEF04